MSEHRGSRFALEVLFLLALAVGLTLADLQPLEIGGVMLLGWLIVAALEWAAWRDEPHYGSGLPPRYYVPTVNLPPARPLEQVPAGYPEAQRDEAPTWIASAALRAEMLGEWPHSAPAEDGAADEVPAEAPHDEVHGDVAPLEPPVSLPPPMPEIEPLPEPEIEPLPEPEPEPEPDPEPEPEPELEPAAVAAHDAPGEATEDRVPLPAPEQAELAPALHEAVLARSGQTVARYSLDPLAEPPVRRRFGRGGPVEPLPVVEVPARPDGVRALPGRPTRQD
jgi:hypothetical protein